MINERLYSLLITIAITTITIIIVKYYSMNNSIAIVLIATMVISTSFIINKPSFKLTRNL